MISKGKILAIDYGTTKIGLAVSDDARILAFGRGIFDRSKGFQKLIGKIRNLADTENITEFVLGLPLNVEAEEGDSARKIRNFAKKLQLSFPDTKFNFVDESFSSFQAQNLQREAGIHGYDDELAAIIILQRYLDQIPKLRGKGAQI